MTTDRNKLLELAKEADCMHVNLYGDRAKSLERLERFAALVLSAAQAEREPVAWMKEHGTAHGPTFTSDPAAVEAWAKLGQPLQPLYTAPPSSDQARNEAIEAAAKLAEAEIGEIADFVDATAIAACGTIAHKIRSLKCPLQAQEPSESGAVDRTLMDAWNAEIGESVVPQKGLCISPLATRPILYTDTIKGGQQALRDDLWAVTTAELNALHLARQDTNAEPLVSGAVDSQPSPVKDGQIADSIEWLADYCRRPQPGEEHLPHLRSVLASLSRAQTANAVPEGFDWEDAEIGRYLMSLATQNSTSSWPRLHKINWNGYAVTNEGDGYRNWSLRESLLSEIAAAPSAQKGGDDHEQ